MIKFTANGQQGMLYGFGLSHDNLRRLKGGQPITVDLGRIGGPADAGTVMIFAGETEEEMAEALRRFVGPQTKVVDPK